MSGVGDGDGRLSSRDGRRGTSSRGLQQRRREVRDLEQGRLLQVDGAARHKAAAGRGRAVEAGPGQGLGGRAGRGRRTGAAAGRWGARDQRESVRERPERERACHIFFPFFVFKLIFVVCHRSWHTANK